MSSQKATNRKRDQKRDRQTDRRSDGCTDIRSYRVALSQLKNTAENRKRTIYQRRMLNDATSMIFTIFWSIFPSARPSIQSPPNHFNSFCQFGTIYGMNTVLSPLNMRSHQLKKLDEVHNFIVFVCIQLNTMNIIDVVSVRLCYMILLLFSARTHS